LHQIPVENFASGRNFFHKKGGGEGFLQKESNGEEECSLKKKEEAPLYIKEPDRKKKGF